MARYGVLDHNQKDTDSPRIFYDEAQALLMLRRQQVTQLNRRLLRRFAPGAPTRKAFLDLRLPAGKLELFVDGKKVGSKGYGLPPREVENCFFKPPQRIWNRDLAYV